MSKGPILIISGTNRPASNALKIANIVESIYHQQGIPAELYSLSQMPAELFAPSSYATKPASWQATQDRIVQSAGLHVISPEYNGSPPGVLKYFIDMLKFQESFEGKPVTFVGEAAGLWGALRPVEQLQAIFGYRNAMIYPVRVFIPQINSKLDAAGQLNDPAIVERLESQVKGFAEFVARFT